MNTEQSGVYSLVSSWKVLMQEFDEPTFYLEDGVFWMREEGKTPIQLGDTKETAVSNLVAEMVTLRFLVIKKFERLVPRPKHNDPRSIKLVLNVGEGNINIWADGENVTRLVCQILNISQAKLSHRKMERWISDLSHIMQYPIAFEEKEIKVNS